MKLFLFLFYFWTCFLFAVDPVLPVYLTWQYSPSTTMTIQWITNADDHSDSIEWSSAKEEKWISASGKHFLLPEGTKYIVHRIELEGLIPASEYLFRIQKYNKTYKFKTVPSSLEKPLIFVAGGDICPDGTQYTIEMNKIAAQCNPSFALLGGDLAYSAGRFSWFSEDQRKWIRFLAAYTETMVTPEGNLIPLIPTIGNHDCKGRFGQTPENAPFFYALFPFPGPQGYNVLDFGDYMSLFVLDSGITHPVPGEQTQWLTQNLEAKKEKAHKFALYHVPAYPSVRDFHFKLSPIIRKNWVPIFEQFGLTTAFENHEHAYKRSHLIKGVLYMGDGAWGVKKPRHPKTPSEAWYIARSAASRHVIMVTLQGQKREYKVLNSQGEKIDEYSH